MNKRAKHHHESIEVLQQSSKRLKLIRQDRKELEGIECFIEFQGTRLKVKNISSFGLLISAKNIDIPNELECPLIIENVDMGILKLKKARVEESEGSLNVGYEIIGEPFDVSRITAVESVLNVISISTKYQNETSRIPDLFARKVYEVKDWLEDLQIQINHIEQINKVKESLNFTAFEQTFVQIMGEYLNQVMPIKNENLSKLLTNHDPEVVKNCYEFFRQKLQAIIYQAPFSNRVYNKPLGYAGDYEMMNIIYRSMPEGETLFAKCLHNYWVQQPAAQAVRNRAQYIKGKIKEHLKENNDATAFLSVACGPAKEWQELIQEKIMYKNLKVHLLDQDELALKHSQRHMKDLCNRFGVNIDFNYHNKAIKNIIVRGLDDKYDMIYSAGLFDYFSDPVAQIAATKLYDALKPGGKLIIGNFNVENPNSIVMDLALDWHLIYRSKADLERLFGRIGDDYKVEFEHLAINLFCVISKRK
jgi:extracellular factor (EF) 3-hydroxypalmitic acid methyl ester biosynthesis protein